MYWFLLQQYRNILESVMRFNVFFVAYILMAAGCALFYNYSLFAAGSVFENGYAFCLYTSLCISIFLAFTLFKQADFSQPLWIHDLT